MGATRSGKPRISGAGSYRGDRAAGGGGEAGMSAEGGPPVPGPSFGAALELREAGVRTGDEGWGRTGVLSGPTTVTLRVRPGRPVRVAEAGQEPPRGKETSTRRFFFRPSSLLLLAIGYCSP